MANRYFAEISEFTASEAIVVTGEEIEAKLDDVTGIYDALKAIAEAKDSHIDKLGLARAIVAICEAPPAEEQIRADVDAFLNRMKLLFRYINRKVRAAEDEKLRHRIKAAVEQHRKIFLQDHPTGATREQGLLLFEKIGDGLDNSLEAKAVRDEMRALIEEFGLDGEPNEPLHDFDAFQAKLRVLKDAFQRKNEVTENAEAKAVAPLPPSNPLAAEPPPPPEPNSQVAATEQNEEA